MSRSDDPTPGADRERRRRSILAELMSLGIMVPATVVAGWLVGSVVDRALGSSPIAGMIGLFLGFAAALVPIFRLNARWERLGQDEPERNDRS